MVIPFQFSNLPALYFGAGQAARLPEIVKTTGNTLLLVTGSSSFSKIKVSTELMKGLSEANIDTFHVTVSGEPSPKIVDEAVNEYRSKNIQVVLSIGGGSVIDAGKAISSMLKHEGSLKDYLDDVGIKRPDAVKVPFIAVPTTAGTGSEATKNAVISETGKKGFKKSLRHDCLVPDVAVIDPELTMSCSPELTGACGMDAFTQLLESYLSTKANIMTDTLAFDAIRKLYLNLPVAYKNSQDTEARTLVAYAAYISGITLANAGLGVVHGFAQPLGSLFQIPHGVVCGTLMAAANAFTIKRLNKDDSIAREKYVKIGKLMAGSHSNSDEFYLSFLVDELNRMTNHFRIKKLSEYGVTEQDFDKIVSFTGLKNHPVKLDKEDLTAILKSRL